MSGQVSKLNNILNLSLKDERINNNFITFTSGKGGTGKTFLSLNIAHTLAASGYKILFVDFDSNLSNSHVLLNTSTENSILDYFKGMSLLKNVVEKSGKNIDYIFGDSGRLDYPKLNVDMVGRFVNDLTRVGNDYDFVIIDSGAGINNEIIYLLSKSLMNVVVSTPEPTSVMDSYAVLKLLANHNSNVDNYLIINNCDSTEQAEEASNNLKVALSHFLNSTINYLGFVNFDPMVRKSIYDQILLVDAYPKCNVSRQISSISAALSGAKQLANINQG
jgi:flagellar biosynthesis protein FlhG